MRKILLAILVLSILILSGCKAPEAEPGVQVQTQAGKTPVISEVTTGKEAQPVKGPELSSELKQLFAKADTVQSLEYFYEETQVGAQYYVLGDNMKIVFPGKRWIQGTPKHYDSVYLDLAKKTDIMLSTL